jgi:hypothetical protein
VTATVRAGTGIYEAELAREVGEFCRRMLGDGEAAREAQHEALTGPSQDRVGVLADASAACRRRAHLAQGPSAPAGDGLAEAAAWEVWSATSTLPVRQREELALRELLRLSYEQIGLALGIDAAAVGALIARARLLLRAELRGSDAAAAACAERERALRVLARRQDSESLDAEDDDWIRAHLGECLACEQAHAAMLEASVRYRAWRSGG